MHHKSFIQDLQSQGGGKLQVTELLHALALMFNFMPGCAKILDEDAHLLSMGVKGQDLMEIDDFKPLRGILWFDVWQGEYNAVARAAFELARQEGYSQFEGFAPTVKGTPKRWHVQIIKVPLGEKHIYLALSEDVTSEHSLRMIEELRTPSQDYELDDHIFSLHLDVEGRITQIDPDLAQRLECAEGDTFFDRLTPEIAYTLRQQLFIDEEQRASFAPVHLELMLIIIPNHQHMHTSASFQPLFAIDGAHIGWQLELIDLRGQESLRQELEMLYDMSPGMIFVLNKQGLIVNANPAVLKHLGYTIDDVLKRPLTNLIDSESMETFQANFNGQVAPSEERDSVHWVRFRTSHEATQSMKWFALSITRTTQGRYDYAYAIDMTEHHLAQQALRQANASLGERNRHLDILRKISHHNLQEPVRKLSIYSSRMLYMIDEYAEGEVAPTHQGDAEEEDMVEELRQSAQAIARVTQSMKDQLRALHKYTDTRQTHLVLRRVKVESVIDQAITLYQTSTLDEAQGDEPLTITIRGDLHLELSCDRDLVATMLHYVIENAHRFTAKDGREATLDIHAKRITTNGEHKLCLSLKDNGRGVEPRHIERILQPFQKLDAGRSGEGMGLALAKRVAENHHATLQCRSEGLNQGFEVLVTFPILPTDQ